MKNQKNRKRRQRQELRKRKQTDLSKKKLGCHLSTPKGRVNKWDNPDKTGFNPGNGVAIRPLQRWTRLTCPGKLNGGY